MFLFVSIVSKCLVLLNAESEDRNARHT